MGKSSERLAEEFAAGVLYDIEPIEQLKLGLVDANPGAVMLDLPAPNLANLYFPSTRHHLQLERDGEMAVVPRNWGIYSQTPSGDTRNAAPVDAGVGGGSVVLYCEQTNALLTAQARGAEISELILAGFRLDAFERRVNQLKAGLDPADPKAVSALSSVPQWTSEFPKNAWQMANRIVTDLLNTPPMDRRAISAFATKPVCLLDLETLLPFLGFSLDAETGSYAPPNTDTPEFTQRLRRILLEVRLELWAYSERRPVLPQLARFLACSARFEEQVIALGVSSRLSGPEYGCLGCVDAFSDEEIYERYQLLAKEPAKDQINGGPWYFEALMRIAQQRNSETLSMYYVELASLGTRSISSIRSAIEVIGLDEKSQLNMSEDQLAEMMLQLGPRDVGAVATALADLRPFSPGMQRILAVSDLSPESAARLLKIPTNTSSPLNRLSTESLVSSDTDTEAATTEIVRRFRDSWINGTSIDRLEARSALLVLALSARDPRLLALYEDIDQSRLASRSQVHSLEAALTLLGLPPSVKNHDFSDEDLMAIFDASAEDLPEADLFELRRALRIIADARNSTVLRQYLGIDGLETDLVELDGQSDTEAPDYGPRLPVGLWNTGNTCYLNSLLQFYYSLPPIREYVERYHVHETDLTVEDLSAAADSDADFEIVAETKRTTEDSICSTEKETDKKTGKKPDEATELSTSAASLAPGAAERKQSPSPAAAPKKIGGRIVPPKEISRSEKFVEQLGRLFREIESSRSTFVTPTELLAYMALVPPQEDADEQTALEAQLAGALQRQQDVTECIENVLYQLEATMPSHRLEEDGEQHDLVKDLFYGTTKQTLARVSDGGNSRSKTERFSSLLLDVNNGPTNIYDSLDNCFAEELLDIEGDGPTLRTLKIRELPQILQIQVQRVQFDTNTYLPYKNLNPLIFPEVVYMDRYLDAPEGTDLHRRQTESKQWKKDCEDLQIKQKESAEAKTALSTVKGWFNSVNAGRKPEDMIDNDVYLEGLTPETKAALDEVLKSQTESYQSTSSELNEVRTRISCQYDDLTQHGYRVHALFIHKGDASYGHYWIYIRNPETDQFYKYNDEIVSSVDNAEVFDFREQNLATPYFLVFTKHSTQSSSEIV